MSEAVTFTFDAGLSTDYGLIMTGVQRPVASPRALVTQDVPGVDGAYLMGSSRGMRTIQIPVMFKATDDTDAQEKLDALIMWLDTDTPRPLTFSDRSGRFWFAMLDENTDLEQIRQRYRVTLTFTCPKPNQWAVDESSFALGEGDTVITNPGGIAVTPRIEATFASPATFLRAECDDRYIEIGQAAEKGVTSVPETSVMMHDDCSTLTGWSAGSQGIITGAMGCDGGSFGPKKTGGSFGTTGSGWHGPSIQKAFPTVDGSNVAQDFGATLRCRLDNSIAAHATGAARYSMAAIWAYGFDEDGSVVVSARLADAWEKVTQVQADFQLGASAFGSGLRTTGPKTTSYNGFNGRVKFGRIGNVWDFSVCVVNSAGVETLKKHASFTDAADAFSSPIARIGLWIAGYQGVSACADEYVTQIDVVRFNDTSTAPAVNVVEAGDTLTLDGWQIRRNGKLYSVALDPKSDPLLVPPGDSDLTLWTDGALSSGTAFIRPAWL